jgi:hypothetical protein
MTRLEYYVKTLVDNRDGDIDIPSIFKIMDDNCPIGFNDWLDCEYVSPTDMDCLECWLTKAK